MSYSYSNNPSNVVLPSIGILLREVEAMEKENARAGRATNAPHHPEYRPINPSFVGTQVPPLQMRPAGHPPYTSASIRNQHRGNPHQYPGPSSQYQVPHPSAPVSHSYPDEASRRAVQGSLVGPPISSRGLEIPQPLASDQHRCVAVSFATVQRSITQQLGPATLARIPDDSWQHAKQVSYKDIAPTPYPIIYFKDAVTGANRNPGVSMIQVLSCRVDLAGAEDWALPSLPSAVSTIKLWIKWEGYTPAFRDIQVNCVHGKITRFNLAYAICLAFAAFFKSKKPHNLTQASGVRDVTRLRLMKLYTPDGTNWMVQVALVLV